MSSACKYLHTVLASRSRLHGSFDPRSVPGDGIYVMFQAGERAHGTDRIVRVGTHSGTGNLPKRLGEHFHKQNKDRSIFRKHVGRCLLAPRHDPFLEQWEIDLTTRKMRERHGNRIDKEKLQAVEDEVTDFLGSQFSFVALAVGNNADSASIEHALLATVAQCGECHPSKNWLGMHHPGPTIRAAGLWNVQGLKGQPLSEQESIEIMGTLGVPHSGHQCP